MTANLQDLLTGREEARQALLDRIVQVLKTDDRFMVAWLTGRHGADAFSDIDVTAVVRKQDVDSLCARPWLIAGRTTEGRLALFRQFGEPAIIHENHHNAPDDGTFTCVIYSENALTVDWTLASEKQVSYPSLAELLFNKTQRSFRKKQDSVKTQEERARVVSERVAFFWMMMTITTKFMLRHDTVFFHMLVDGLERTLVEVSRLAEARTWEYHSGSVVKLAISQHEQAALIRGLAERMLALMPKVVELGGSVPDEPMRVIDQLLEFGSAEESVPKQKSEGH